MSVRALTRASKAIVRDTLAEVAWRVGVSAPSRTCRGELVIATFHRVLPAELRAQYAFPELVVTPEELAFFLRFFREHFTVTTLGDAHRRMRLGERPARPLLAVTFDDGQRDNFEYGKPVLDEHGVKASFYVTVDATEADAPLWHDRVGFAIEGLRRRDPSRAAALLANRPLPVALEEAKRMSTSEREAWVERVESEAGRARPSWDGMMSWDQLRTLHAEGHEIGSHTRTHPILPRCDDARLETEIVGSRARLREELGAAVDTFCYPNGDHDVRVRDVVRRAGYVLGVTTDWGRNPPSIGAYELRRFDIQSETSRGRDGRLSRARLALRFSGLQPGLTGRAG